jgi:hypothetical protein
MTNRGLIDLEALSTLFPYGVASMTSLLNLGLTSPVLKRRCSPGGPWRKLLPGIVLLSNASPTHAQRVQAALRYVSGSIVTGHDALALHGIRAASLSDRIHLLVPTSRFACPRGCLIVERTSCPPKPALRSGLLVAPLARAAMDAARRMTSHPAVHALFMEVVFSSGVRLDDLHTELTVGGRRGAALPRQVLHEIATRIRSDLAVSARLLVERAGLPAPVWNVPITDLSGSPLGTVTATWASAGLAWDVHAFDLEPAPASYPTALRRCSRLAATGVRVVHTPATLIRTNPEAVIAELLSAHTAALAR